MSCYSGKRFYAGKASTPTMQHVYDTISRSLNLPFARLRNPRRLEDEATAYHQTLNYDLWYRIASYLTIEDARSLAMVCKECHAATLPRLLSSMEPSDESGLQKMCTSLSSSVYYPASLLQGLRIGRKALGAPNLAAGWIRYRFQRKSPIPGALATVLSQAVNLRSLSLQCVEDLIEADARLGDALATLKCLDTLDLLDIGPKTFEVAMRIESRPTAFGLHYESRDSTPDDLLRLMEIPLLERVRKLVLCRFQFGNAPMNADLPGVKSLRPWPAVEELRLSFCSYLPFHQLFPNLRVLSLWRAWQMADADMSLVAWPPAAPLRRATVDQHNIRCLLGTPVHFLDLKSYFVDREATLSAVRETSPVALSLWCPQGEGTSHEFWSGVISAANAPQARLRYLIITLPVDLHDGLRWLGPWRVQSHHCASSLCCTFQSSPTT
ncbi:hypothetical protein FOMPIDRAFT_115712 [Fomitopsis schrenkii]|uniref:F-box domain-containing protein n=1 Tax=Fomitopsis schrenkii TaxID=2126942 RepID=S8FEE2_FOMSC|nr:hypothetical protein FOMPIDRAFT_115712 [Fomitopsis schrenkii]